MVGIRPDCWLDGRARHRVSLTCRQGDFVEDLSEEGMAGESVRDQMSPFAICINKVSGRRARPRGYLVGQGGARKGKAEPLLETGGDLESGPSVFGSAMSPDCKQGYGHEHKGPASIEHHIPELASPCEREALMPLVKRGDKESTRDGQGSPHEACGLRKGCRKGTKPEKTENPVSEKVAALPKDGVEPVEARRVHMTEQPNHDALQNRAGVCCRSEGRLHGNDHCPKHDRKPDTEQ